MVDKDNTNLYIGICVAVACCCLLLSLIGGLGGYYATRDKTPAAGSTGNTGSAGGTTTTGTTPVPPPSAISSSVTMDCSKSPALRTCPSDMNIGYMRGVAYLCPPKSTLVDSYPPAGITVPSCHMNNGGTVNGQVLPTECGNYDDEGCNMKTYKIPCYGIWNSTKYPIRSFYPDSPSRWQVAQAMPLNELCNPSKKE